MLWLLCATLLPFVGVAAPLCEQEGLWGTAWCLSATTLALARDGASFTAKAATPLSVWNTTSAIIASLPHFETRGFLVEKLGDGSVALITVARLAPTAEAFRKNFTLAFPSHASLLPEGDLAGLLAMLSWISACLALACGSARTVCRRRIAPEVSFFPDPTGKQVERIIAEIAGARHRIWLAMFILTDDSLSAALLAAHQRGVDVRLVVDDAQRECLGADPKRLAEAGLPVVMDMAKAHMHHKFAVIDSILLTGSFNWTRQASRANQENLMVLHDSSLVRAFAKEFSELWQEFDGRGGRLPGKGRKGRRDKTPPNR